MKNKKTVLIAQTAVLIALLVVSQAATAPLGNQFVTGSIVNMLLVVSVMTGGIFSGLSAALVSPFLAKLVGIGPAWELIPFIAAGNAVLILLWHFIGNIKIGKNKSSITAYFIALPAAALAKFAVLYLGVTKIAVPLLLNLPEAVAAKISAMFSFPQLITASIGGALAATVLPILKKALKKEV
ncbi:MAG: hypothetical protein FWF08_05980 [Oscillospiraceae bacterium]|nr:hypothetical protein [Oscillospiraceae bacterium]